MLTANAVHGCSWRAWADEALIKICFASPIWLVNLALSESESDALKAVSEDIGLESENCASHGINVDALVFGFVYEKSLKVSTSFDEQMDELFKVGDFAQFMDSGSWKEYQHEPAVDLSNLSKQNRISAKLLPIAEHAAKTRESMLNFQFT